MQRRFTISSICKAYGYHNTHRYVHRFLLEIWNELVYEGRKTHIQTMIHKRQLKTRRFLVLSGFYLKSRQNTPTSVVDEQVGDECSHISFHPCFLSVFHESFLKFFSRSWYNDVNKRRFSIMKSYRTYSSILSANHPQNPRLFCSYASC